MTLEQAKKKVEKYGKEQGFNIKISAVHETISEVLFTSIKRKDYVLIDEKTGLAVARYDTDASKVYIYKDLINKHCERRMNHVEN